MIKSYVAPLKSAMLLVELLIAKASSYSWSSVVHSMVTSPNRSSCDAWNGPVFWRFAKKPIPISSIQISVPVNSGPI